MFFYPKSKCYIKTYCLCLFLGGSLLTSSNLLAGCAVLNLHKMRSSDTYVTNNRCSNATDLSLASVVELQAGTRVWMESPETAQNAATFQIICQNNSLLPVKIKVAQPFLPWINPLNISHCNSWVDNRLVCKQTEDQNVALLCAIAQKPSNNNIRAIQLKTSLTMRSTNQATSLSEDDLRKWAEIAKPGISLCRQIVDTQEPITLSWTIKASGEVFGATLAEAVANKQFAACALEALENSDFPEVVKDLSITFKF